MAEHKIAIGLICSLMFLAEMAMGQEPVVTLQQPIQYKQRECDCAGCLRDRGCLRRNEELEGETVERELREPGEDVPVVDLVRPAIFNSEQGESIDDPVGESGNPSLSIGSGNLVRMSDVNVEPATALFGSGYEVANTSCDCEAAHCDLGCELGCDAAGCDSASCDAGGALTCDSTGCDSAGCDAPGCGSGCGLLGNSTDIDWSCLNLCCRKGFWLRAEALLWWTNDDNIPSLVTSSPLGTPIDDAGVLGFPTTTSLYDDPIFGDARFGGRLRFGWWPTEGTQHGLEGSIWGLIEEDDGQTWASDGDPILARPFFNVDPLVNARDAQLIAHDGILRGQLGIETSSEIFGGDIGFRKNICCCADFCGSTSTRFDLYAGYRYFRVREGLRITENLESTALVGPTVLGTTIDLYDDFQTTNEFNGGTFGFTFAQQYRRLTTEVVGRLSLGNISREASIDGATTVTVPTLAPVTTAGGILAQPTNIGTYSDDEFAVLPEIQFNFLYNIRCNTRLLFGYTFMYLGDLVRPGDIINTNVNGLLLDPTVPTTGPQQPAFAFRDSRTWLMGLSFGLEVNF